MPERRAESQRSHAFRLTLIFGLASLVPLALLTYFSFELTSNALEDEVRARIRSSAELSATAISNELVGFTRLASSFAQRPKLIEAMEGGDLERKELDQIRLQLKELQRAQPGISTAFIASNEGKLIDVVPSTPSIIGDDFSYRDWYQGVTRTDRPYLSEAYKSLAKGHPTVVAAADFIRPAALNGGPRDKPLGILVAGYSLNRIKDFGDQYSEAGALQVTVTDHSGVLVAGPESDATELVSRKNDPAVSEALQGHIGIQDSDGPMGEELKAYAPISPVGWTVTVSIPKAVAFDPVVTLRSTVLSIAGLLALMLLVALFLVSRVLRARYQAERRAALALKEADTARQEAIAANEAKSGFLSRVSHEIRTPLNSILGFSQLLQMDNLSDDQRENVDHIVKGGQHLLQLINEILDISRIEAGQLAISIEPVPVDAIISESKALIDPIAAAESTRVEILEAPPQGDLHVMADHQRAKQILVNLLSNAIKYGGSQGPVRVTSEVQDDVVRIGVMDQGAGIPPEKLENLFVPFDRLGLDESSIEGTGLGLALSQGLANAMGGTIDVASESGRGTTFTLELPRAQRPEEIWHGEAEESPSLTSAQNGATTLLYIEDNLSNLKLVDRLLERTRPGVELIIGMQGRLGLELAKRHRPDVILLDLNLPDIPGDEILRILRSDPLTSSIPVIMLSADATSSQVERLLSQGATAYVTKPLVVDAFLSALDAAIAKQEKTIPDNRGGG